MGTVTVKVSIPTSNQRGCVEKRHPSRIVSTCFRSSASLLSRSGPSISAGMANILSFIPHPVLYPLFDHFFTSARYIEQQYLRLLDLREILCIEELLFQIRISHKYVLDSYLELEYALSIARMLVKTANQGISYIERHCRESGLKLDLHALNSKRISSFAHTDPYDTLLPYAHEAGLLTNFGAYDQYRGYEHFLPAKETMRRISRELDAIKR